MGKLQGRGMSVILRRASEKSIPGKRVLYVRGKHCGLPGFGFPGSMQTSQKEEIGFTHVGLSNYCARG